MPKGAKKRKAAVYRCGFQFERDTIVVIKTQHADAVFLAADEDGNLTGEEDYHLWEVQFDESKELVRLRHVETDGYIRLKGKKTFDAEGGALHFLTVGVA